MYRALYRNHGKNHRQTVLKLAVLDVNKYKKAKLALSRG